MKPFVILLVLLTVARHAALRGDGRDRDLSWLGTDQPDQQYLRFIAPNVLEDTLRELADPRHDPALHVRRLLDGRVEDARAPRARRVARVLGWMPGGLAIVCIVASAFFTTLTGGSGVTIVAIGGLLYPALRQQGYSEKFSLGLVTTAGSLGLLLFPARSAPGLRARRRRRLQRGVQGRRSCPGSCSWCCSAPTRSTIGIKDEDPAHDVRSQGGRSRRCGPSSGSSRRPAARRSASRRGSSDLDESAAVAALYTLRHRGLRLQGPHAEEGPRAASRKDAMTLAGAVILILAMANALTNYVVHEHIPQHILEWFVARRARHDVAVPHRLERLPARPRHVDGRLQRASSSRCR